MSPKFLKYTAFEISIACIEMAVVSAAHQPLEGAAPGAALQRLVLAAAAANPSGRGSCRRELGAFWAEMHRDGRMT